MTKPRLVRRHVGGGDIPEDEQGYPLCTHPMDPAYRDGKYIPPNERFCRKPAVALYHAKRRGSGLIVMAWKTRAWGSLARCPYHDFLHIAWALLEPKFRREVVDKDLDARLARDRAGKS